MLMGEGASQLQLMFVDDTPGMGSVAPLPRERLIEVFGTDRPTRQQVDARRHHLFEAINRGEGVYLIVHDDRGEPAEIYLAGYTFD